MAESTCCQLIIKQCPDCGGWGEIMTNCLCHEDEYSSDDPHDWETCTRCMGVGEIEVQIGPRIS